jgi:hypothetical protein
MDTAEQAASGITGLIVIFVLWILPIICCVLIAKKRNRSPGKALVVGVLTGWIGTLFLWLGLKTRGIRKNGERYLY